MFILPQAPKHPMYHTSGTMFNGIKGETQANIEATCSLTELDDDLSFMAPEGLYEAKDCLTIPTPTPHPSDTSQTNLNPLAPSSFSTNNVKLSVISFKNDPAPGTLEFNQQMQAPIYLNDSKDSFPSVNSVLSNRNSQNTHPPPSTKSRWTSTFWASSSSNVSNRRGYNNNTDEKGSTESERGNPNASSTHSLTNRDSQVSTKALGNASGTSTPMSSHPKRKSIVSSLSLGTLNISNSNSNSQNGQLASSTLSSNGNNTPVENAGTDQNALIPQQPTGYIGSTVIPPSAIGTSPFLQNLHIYIPSTPIPQGKRKRPKNSLVKNYSSFVSRTIAHDNLSRRLGDRTLDSEYLVWANVGRSLVWLDFTSKLGASAGSQISKDDPLSRILFTKSQPTCHDVNKYTRSPNGLDMVVGMSSGDALWLDPANNRYHRINKNGDITNSPVTAIKWIPGSENLFVTLHANGSLIIFDKDREDGGFATQGGLLHQDDKSTDVFRIVKSLYPQVSASTAHGVNSPNINGISKYNEDGGDKSKSSMDNGNGNASSNGNSNSTSTSNKYNPVAMYKLSHRALTSIEFSPDRQTLVITSSDGYLRFLNLATEVVTDIFPSYYDGFLCCAFSPDGKYLATGGQDDLVTIWSVKRRAIIARGHGHRSWVNKVAFDHWNCDEFSYRLGSVGDEGALILWDFSPSTLSRPKAKQHHQRQQKNQKKDDQTAGDSTNGTTTNNGGTTKIPVNGLSKNGTTGIFRHTYQSSISSCLSNSTISPHDGQNGGIYSISGGTNNNSMDISSVTSLKSANPSLNGSMAQNNAISNINPWSAQNPFVTIVRPFVGKEEVAQITPVMTKSIRLKNSENNEPEPLGDLVFLKNTIMVSSKDGRIWTWSRNANKANLNTSSEATDVQNNQ